MVRYKQKVKNRKTRKRTIVACSLIVILVLIAVAFVIKKDNSSTPVTASAYTKGDVNSHPGTVVTSNGTPNTSNNNTTGSISDKAGSETETSSGSNTASTATLITPTGDFVSDHEPNISGSPHPNTLTSVCSTTPGATCYITFTNGGTTKSLSMQQVDSGGSTYWNWSLQSVGLTEGSWKVEAIATLNGQTKIAYDAMDLTVSQ